MKCALVLIGMLLVSPMATYAQTTDAATRDLIQRLLTRVDTLEKRVAELEKQTSSTPTAQAPIASRLAEPYHATHDNPPEAVAASQPSYPSLKISGFTDFYFAASDLRGTSGGFGAATLLNSHSGFQEGQFALHFSSALSPRVSFFGELSLTARPDAGTGTPAATGFNAEVERAV